MSSDQTIDLVEHGVAFHQLMHKYFKEWHERATADGTRMALEYLMKHQKDLEQSLRNYEADVPPLIAQRWFKYSPGEELKRTLDENDMAPDAPVADIADFMNRCTQHLIRFYTMFSEMNSTPELEEILEGLRSQEEEELKLVVRSLQDDTQ